jgi:hypothetical protein
MWIGRMKFTVTLLENPLGTRETTKWEERSRRLVPETPMTRGD